MRISIAAGVLAAVCISAGSAAAQQPELPKWDAGASLGLLFGDGWYAAGIDSYGEPHAAYHFEVGRFWTTHLKTDYAVVLTHDTHSSDYIRYPVTGLPGAYTFIDHDRRLTGFSGAVTYQFFENQMMHPFVSAGVQFGVNNDHAYRDSQVYTVSRITYTVPALDARESVTLVRPFIAVGAKSYFNERTFLKSEFAMGFNGDGVSHSILRLGFGFDF